MEKTFAVHKTVADGGGESTSIFKKGLTEAVATSIMMTENERVTWGNDMEFYSVEEETE